MPHEVDPRFLALPMRGLADAALERARDLGTEYAAFRFNQTRVAQLLLRDAELEGSHEAVDTGFSVWVVHDGTCGFAAGIEMTPEAAVAVAEQAVAAARMARPINTEPVELTDESVHHEKTWVSSYEVNPFDVPEAERIALLAGWSERLLASKEITHVQAKFVAAQENKFYADLAGTVTTQQRVRVHPQLLAVAVDSAAGTCETLRTLGPPVGRGWEYLAGTGWDWDDELARMPELLSEKLRAPSVQSGSYDLVIDPSNLWLTIHELVGHATELDRALGYEASYAGTTFATFDQLGTLRYGSPMMNVVGDRTAEHGLATIGYDDEGVAAQSWDIVRDGVLVGYQLDRRTARLKGFPRSNGCAFAESGQHVPLQRMANVSLQPAPDGPNTEELISDVADGIYVVGSNSWSIDMQRYHFQFTGQRFYRIRKGRLAGQLRDLAYQGTTTDFWGSLVAVGGQRTYALFGADYCGKGQPVQAGAASHGCPSALFRDIFVLNTAQEG